MLMVQAKYLSEVLREDEGARLTEGLSLKEGFSFFSISPVTKKA